MGAFVRETLFASGFPLWYLDGGRLPAWICMAVGAWHCFDDDTRAELFRYL